MKKFKVTMVVEYPEKVGDSDSYQWDVEETIREDLHRAGIVNVRHVRAEEITNHID